MSAISHQDFRLDRLDTFWRFVCERQKIWHRRFVQRLQPPWTEDPILQTERFTNVYRELDPGTQYVLQCVLEIDAPKADKIFNVMLYRLIGRSQTHAAVGFQYLDRFDPVFLEQSLKYIRDVEGKPPFTAAYMVSGYTNMGSRDKVENVVELLTQLHVSFNSFYARLSSCTSSSEAYDVIRTTQGFGNFLAYQVLVDLLYPLCAYNHKPLLPYSHDDWASAGPGAQRGISMLLCQRVRAAQLPVMRWLRENQQAEFNRLRLDFPFLSASDGTRIDISLANIQNCLCEFHKYVKIAEGKGRGRRKFRPTTRAGYEQFAMPLGERVTPPRP